ncbi:MAG TPA: hypothetical protein DCY58_06015 [Acetobacterium sp.]|nr:hypothetical protein [Acetobacterium sp.]
MLVWYVGGKCLHPSQRITFDRQNLGR